MAYEFAGDSALDYFPCRYGQSKLLFRGPRRRFDGPYAAAIGGTETYGKFVADPYPALVRDKAKNAAAYCPPGWRYALGRLAGDDSLRSVWLQVRMLTPFFRLRNRIVRLFVRN